MITVTKALNLPACIPFRKGIFSYLNCSFQNFSFIDFHLRDIFRIQILATETYLVIK
jgi:hypothetical protein